MYEIQRIKTDFYALIWHIDNSAPCSKCAFFRKMRCEFPIDEVKKCVAEKGTSKGWNTREYMLIPEGHYKVYGVI